MHTTPGSEAQLITLRREERDAAALNNFRILERELKRSGRGIAGSPLNNSEVARKVAQEVSKALYGSDLDPLHHYIPNGSDALQQIIMRHLQGETLEKEENRRLSDKDWQLDIKFLPTDDGSLVVGYDLKLKITSGWVSVVWGNTKGIALTQTGTAASPIENLPALDSQIKSATEGQGNIGAMKDVVSRLRQTRLFDVLGTQGREENYAAYLGRIGEAAQSRVRAHAYEISQQRHNDQGISPDEETAARADWIQAEHELLQPVSGYLKQAQTAFDSAAQDAAAYIAHAIINLVFRSTGGAEGNLDTTHRLTEEIARSFRDPAGVTFSLQQRAQERAGRRDPGMTVTFSYRDRETGREMNSLLHGFFLTSERLDKSGYTLGDMLTRVEHTRAARELAEFAETRPLINLPNLEARIEKAIEVFNAYQAEPSPAADGIAQIIGGLSLTILAARNKPLLELLRQFHYHYDDRIKGNRIVLTLSGHPTTIVGDRLIPALSEYLRAIPIEIKKTVAATAREFRQNYQGPEATDDEHWLAAEEYLFSRFGSLAGGASSAVEFGQYLEKLLSAGKTRVHFKDTKLGYLKVTGEEIVGDSWMRTVNSAQDLDLTVSLDLGRKMLILQRRPSSSGDVKSVMSGESSRTESPSGTSSASDEEITSQFTQVIRNYWEKHTQKGFPMKNGIEDKKVLWKVNFALRQKGFQPIGLSELDVLQNALAAGGIQMHKVDRSLFKVKRRYYVIYSVKPVSSSPSPATAGSPAVTADDLRDTADRILRNIGMRSMHVHITTVMADVTERLHGAEATRQNVMDAVAAINHRLGEFPGASLYEVSNDGVISLPSDNDPDGRRSLSEEWGRIKTLNYENMPVTAIMQRLTLTPEAVYTALKAISASRDYLSMFFVQNGRIVTEEKNHMTDSRQYPDFNRAEFTQVASSNLGLTTTPGGIKMSNIPVISSAASQKIEFAAIGPDFFDRLTFRIVSMKHIVSLAQFASLP
jgi:hypothetical protein